MSDAHKGILKCLSFGVIVSGCGGSYTNEPQIYQIIFVYEYVCYIYIIIKINPRGDFEITSGLFFNRTKCKRLEYVYYCLRFKLGKFSFNFFLRWTSIVSRQIDE